MDVWGTCKKVAHENSLTLVLLALFLITLAGQIVTGWHDYNEDRREHGRPEITLGPYLSSGHSIEATGENWESEFLQMAMFVLLTVRLHQKGSPDSKPLDDDDDEDLEAECNDPRAPWPVRRGGVILWLYSHSLSFAFMLLFFISFMLHAYGGAIEYSEQQLWHGQPAVGMLTYMGTAKFWFESLQNWQSEFLSLAAMVYFLVFLREKGSAESKRVAAAIEDQE
jgi:hypothetical protein